MASDENERGGGGADNDESSGLKLSEAIRKVITAGIGAAFMTEESVRAYLSELKLPKDVLNLLLQSAAKSKEELVGRVGNEIIKMVNKIDFVKEASRFVEEHKFKISAEVEVLKRTPAGEEKSPSSR